MRGKVNGQLLILCYSSPSLSSYIHFYFLFLISIISIFFLFPFLLLICVLKVSTSFKVVKAITRRNLQSPLLRQSYLRSYLLRSKSIVFLVCIIFSVIGGNNMVIKLTIFVFIYSTNIC